MERMLPVVIAVAVAWSWPIESQAAESDSSSRRIRLQVAAFDPLRDGEPALGDRVPSATDRYRLVQLDSAATAARQRDLAARGYEIVGSVPEHALIVRVPTGTPATSLESVAGVRWVGRVLPGYKISPELSRLLARDGAAESLTVFLFHGEDVESAAAAIRGGIEGARIVLARGGMRPRVEVDVPPDRLAPAVGALAREPAVQYVALRPRLGPQNDQAVWIGQSYDRVNGPVEAAAPDPKPYALSGTIWSRGLTGAGQVIAVADMGLEPGMCFFADTDAVVVPQSVAPPAPLVLDHGHRKILALNAPLASSYDTVDPFRHGTHVSASVAGDDDAHAAADPGPAHDHGDGVAPGAKLVFEDLSGPIGADCFPSIVLASLADLLEQEYATGARISTNSWGTSGDADATAALDADVSGFEHEDLLLLWSAGNNGGGGLNAFATCKNCVSVGAGENYDTTFGGAFGALDPENMAAFSSRGPTADGRIKPDVVAPGFRVDSARFPVVYIADEGDPACDPGNPEVCEPNFGGCYVTDPLGECHVDLMIGTSMATPLVAGFAALARQYFVEGFHPSGEPRAEDARVPSAALLKAILINAGRNMTGHLYERRGTPVDFGSLAEAPSNVQGWGRVALDDALHFTGEARRTRLFDLPVAHGLATGHEVRTQFSVTASDEPLELTLVWTDAPGQPFAGGALVNDLDLELTAPDGTLYRGNQWTADLPEVAGDRQSLADPPGRDGVNNVEGVRLATPATGLYSARVVGFDVPGDAGVFTQGAALVATGGIDACTTAAAPADLRVESFGAAGVSLAWDPVPGALGYTLLRNTTGCGDPMATNHAVALASGPTTALDASVVPNTVYHYTVRAVMSPDGCETADSGCVSALTIDAAPPPPVPDGRDGAPLLVGKGPTSFRLVVDWDSASCPAQSYHLIHGPLDGVAEFTIAGAKCGLGAGGHYQWFGVPSGDLWFLVLSASATEIEGSWGESSDGAPRGDGSASGQCGTLVRDESAVCE